MLTSRLRFLALAPVTLALAGCVSMPDESASLARADAPQFDPFTFFAGTSQGTGTFTKMMADPVPVTVESRGRIETIVTREAAWAAPPRRVLVLEQTLREGDKPARKRQWRLTEVAPGRYEGTLTGAIGPVRGEARGNLLMLDYPIKDGFQVHQELTLAPDGTRAANVLKVSQLGMTVAVLTEDIRKTP